MAQRKVDPDDIPTSVTSLVYTAPWIGKKGVLETKLSQNEIAAQLAHYWPAIEEYILEQAADRVAALPTANSGGLIHATRTKILNTITTIEED